MSFISDWPIRDTDTGDDVPGVQPSGRYPSSDGSFMNDSFFLNESLT